MLLMSRSFMDDFNNPDLFKTNKAGEYSYTKTEMGKSACGSLKISDNPVRDSKAQLKAGGQARRTRGNEWGGDDGGHLIGSRFGGNYGEENLTAQNSNLNRSQYKKLENKWANFLNADKDNKVFVNIESAGPDRPSAYMGYAIYENKNGERRWEAFYMDNEGIKWNDHMNDLDQDAWNENSSDFAKFTEDDEYNGFHDTDYGYEDDKSIIDDEKDDEFFARSDNNMKKDEQADTETSDRETEEALSEPESEEDYTEDSEEDYTEDSEEDYTEDSEEDYTEDSEEDYTEDSEEDYAEDSQEDYTEDSEEDYTEDSEEDYAEDSDENYAEDSEEDYSVDSEEDYSAEDGEDYSVESEEAFKNNSDEYDYGTESGGAETIDGGTSAVDSYDGIDAGGGAIDSCDGIDVGDSAIDSGGGIEVDTVSCDME